MKKILFLLVTLLFISCDETNTNYDCELANNFNEIIIYHDNEYVYFLNENQIITVSVARDSTMITGYSMYESKDDGNSFHKLSEIVTNIDYKIYDYSYHLHKPIIKDYGNKGLLMINPWSYIYRSMDNGKSWQEIKERYVINAVITDDADIFAIKGMEILRSKNNGNSFESMYKASDYEIQPVFIETHFNKIFMIDYLQKLYVSDDKGITWVENTSLDYSKFYSDFVANNGKEFEYIDLISDNKGNLILHNYANHNLFISSDQGKTWNSKPIQINLKEYSEFNKETETFWGRIELYSVDMNGNIYISVGYPGDKYQNCSGALDIFKSSDLGDTWQKVFTVRESALGYNLSKSGYLFECEYHKLRKSIKPLF